jgi:hypothetical protein
MEISNLDRVRQLASQLPDVGALARAIDAARADQDAMNREIVTLTTERAAVDKAVALAFGDTVATDVVLPSDRWADPAARAYDAVESLMKEINSCRAVEPHRLADLARADAELRAALDRVTSLETALIEARSRPGEQFMLKAFEKGFGAPVGSIDQVTERVRNLVADNATLKGCVERQTAELTRLRGSDDGAAFASPDALVVQNHRLKLALRAAEGNAEGARYEAAGAVKRYRELKAAGGGVLVQREVARLRRRLEAVQPLLEAVRAFKFHTPDVTGAPFKEGVFRAFDSAVARTMPADMAPEEALVPALHPLVAAAGSRIGSWVERLIDAGKIAVEISTKDPNRWLESLERTARERVASRPRPSATEVTLGGKPSTLNTDDVRRRALNAALNNLNLAAIDWVKDRRLRAITAMPRDAYERALFDAIDKVQDVLREMAREKGG